MFSRNSQNGQSFFRFTSFFLNFVFIYLFAIFPFTEALVAAPQYKTFDERGKSQMENYFDRGKALSNEAQWQNFVDQGLGVSQAQWESEARAALDKEKAAIDATTGLDDAQKLAQKNSADTTFNQARLDWLTAAVDRVLAERGKWKAIVGNAFVAEVNDATYQQIITQARTAVLGQDLNLSAWDASVDPDKTDLNTQFTAALTAEVNRIASANLSLSGTERTTFDAELARIESDIRAEYNLKQNYYLRRARNQYIAEKRIDLTSAKSEAEKESASYITDQLLKQTWESVNGMTSDALGQAVNAALGQQNAGINDLGQDWQRQIEAIVSQGLRSWEVAEEDLMEQRITWANKEKTLLKDGGEIWKGQYERIKAEKEKWMVQVRTQILEGRAQWDQKYVQFEDERAKADTEFQRLLTTENDRWNGYNDKLIEMVTTGGAALAQAQDAIAFYNSVLPATPNDTPTNQTIRNFYQSQINYFTGALTSFNGLLNNVRTEMQSSMLSQNADSGYLVDRRVFAGTVPAEIQAMGSSGFRAALLTKLDTFSEAYVLYDRDLRREIQRADIYAQSSQQIGTDLGTYFAANPGYNFSDIPAKLNTYSDDHQNVKTDILQLWNTINTDNTTYPDANAKKTALQTQIQTLLTGGMNVDQSLFNRVTAYFNTPYGGNYLTAQDNDPYLMTQAEYEWELLRNRRNFLAAQLETSEAVYKYAQVAHASGAGLELASVTKEAADIQKVYADLAELKYKILKGDIALNADVKTVSTMRDDELTRLLNERSIDVAKITNRESQIATEQNALNAVIGSGAVTMGTDLDAYIAAFDAWRGTNPATPSGTADIHYLAQYSDKLIQLKNEWVAGLTGDALLEKQQRWTQLKSAAGALSQSLTDLQGNYRFAQLAQKLTDIKSAMIPQNLVEIGQQLTIDKTAIETQAIAVANAKAIYDQQQDIYRQTKKNFAIISLPNSQQIINTEISNMGQQLGAVTNRLVFVTGAAEMKDVVTATELDYYRILRDRTEAQKDVSYTVKTIQAIDNLKLAKAQNTALDNLLATGFAGKSIDLIATDFTSAESSLITRAGSPVSWQKTIDLFDSIDAQKGQYLTHRANLAAAQLAGNVLLIAQSEKAALLSAEALRQSIDGFIVALRMEKKINSEALDYLLDTSTALSAGASTTLSATILQKEVGDAVTRKSSQYERLNEAAANHLATLVNSVISGGTQATTTSETLIKAVDDQIAQLMGGTDRSSAGAGWVPGSSYDFGLFEGKTDTTFRIQLEKLWVVRAYLTDFNVKNRIDNLSSIPPPQGVSIQEKWQKFAQEVQGYQQKNQIYHDITARAPASANDNWVTTFATTRAALRNDLTSLLSAPTDTALRNALTTYLSGMSTQDANDARYILQSYIGHYLNEGSTANLRNDITAARNAMTQELSRLNLNYGEIWAKEQYLSKDREARTLESQLGDKLNQVGSKNLEIQSTDAEIAQLTALMNAATAAGNAAEAALIQNEIDTKSALKATLVAAITTLNTEISGLHSQIDPLRAYAGELLNRGSSLVLAPFISGSLWQYEIEEEGYKRLNSEWSTVKDASYRIEQAQAETTLTDTIKLAIGFYKKDAYGNIDLSSGAPQVSAEFIALYPAATPGMDISVLLGGTQTGNTLESWVNALATFMDRAQAERKNVPDNLKQAIAGLESSLIEYLSAEAFIARRGEASGQITAAADTTRTYETERLKNVAKVLTFYQNINSAMSSYNGSSPLGAYSAFIAELSKKQNRELLTLFNGAAPDAAVHNSLTELFALTEQLKDVRQQLYSAQIQQQFLAARQTAYAQSRVLSVSEFMAGVDVLKTDSIRTSIGNIAADGNFVSAVTQYLTGSTASELYLTKLWDIVSAFPVNGTDIVGLKSNLLAALQGDAFVSEIRNELTALSPRDLYTSTSVGASSAASINAFIAEQAVRADTFKTNFSAYLGTIPGGTTTASAIGLIDGWLQNITNVPVMQQDYAAEISHLMQNLGGAIPLSQLVTELTNFAAQLANPSAGEQQKMKNLVEQSQVALALNGYYFSSNWNSADYPAELKNFILLKGYHDLSTTYQEFLRLKGSAIADEQNAAVLDLSGHPKEMQRHFYLNDFYAFMDSDPTPSPSPLRGEGGSAAAFVAEYLKSRRTDASVIGFDLVKEFTNIVLHTRHNTLSPDLVPGQANQIDVNKEPKEFRERLLMAKFDHHIANNAITLTGGTAADLFNDFKTKFDAFLSDNDYRIGGVELKDQLAGNIELNDFRNKAYAYYNANNNGGGNLNAYLPALYAGTLSPVAFGAYTRTNADTLLPSDLTGIANYKTTGKGYTNSLSDSLKTIYLKQKLAGDFDTAGAYSITSADIAQMITTSGYSMSAAVNSALNTYFNDTSLAAKVAANTPGGAGQSPSEALFNLRLTKAVEWHFAAPADADKKDGLLANRTNLSAVERLSYTMLNRAGSNLRALANSTNVANFTLAAWEMAAALGTSATLSTGTSTYHSGLSPSQKVLFDDYVLAINSQLSEQNKKFITDYRAELATYLSGSSMLFNGDLEKSERSIRGALEHLTDQSARTAAKDNFNAFYEAFAAFIQGGPTSAVIGTVTITQADFTKMAAHLSSAEKGFLVAELTRLSDFFLQIREGDAERKRVVSITTDASRLSPVYALDTAYEIKIAQAIAEANLTAVTDAIGQKIKANQAITSDRQRNFGRNLAVADNLKRFASLRGELANVASGGSLFLNYRSFVGTVAGKQSVVYTNPTPNMPAYLQGKTLKQNVLSLGGNTLDAILSDTTLINNILVSDSAISGADAISGYTVAGGNTVYEQQINTVNAAANTNFNIAYSEHLANNYLGSVSGMNRSLASIFAMAESEDKSLRPEVGGQNRREALVKGELANAITAYGSSQNLDALYTAVEGVKQNREGLLVNGLSANALLTSQKQIEQNTALASDAKQKLAEAAHRDVLLGANARDFIDQQFTPVSAALNQAQTTYDNAVATLNANKAAYANTFTAYTGALNSMSAAFKTFQVENSDAEKKAAVKDFATTAYLFASSTQASATNEADAKQMYEAAKLRYETVQQQLQVAADGVRTQDTLTQLSDLINKIDQGLPLSVQELAMKAVYQQFIDARKEYVLESERMIRVKKAQEILNAEIEKRKAVAELKLAAYNKSKDEFIDVMNDGDATAVQNRDQTIAYLNNLRNSAGNAVLYDVLAGMFYTDDTYDSNGNIFFSGTTENHLKKQAVLDDRSARLSRYNAITPADKAILDQFRNYNAGGAMQSGSYGGFKGAYRAMVDSWEKREGAREVMNWTIGVMTPILIAGNVMALAGLAFTGIAAALKKKFWTKWLAPVFSALGIAYGSLAAIITLPASLAIYQTVTDYENKDADLNAKRGVTDEQRDKIAAKLADIQNKEEEYLQAQAALDYFTKAPSQAVLKDRIIQYGAQTNDNGGLNRYTVYENDLRYIRDTRSAGHVDSSGTAYTPNTVDQTRALSIDSATTTPVFKTASGDHYDPTITTTQNLEPTLLGGYYWANNEKYVKTKRMTHSGGYETIYAKYLPGNTPPSGAWDVYSLGDVMNISSNHTDILRSQLKQQYFDAGAGPAATPFDATLMLAERDKTMWNLWDYADQQGKPYGGFRVMAQDYSENTTAVFQKQRQQNATLVTQQWDLRRAELDAARARWENLATTIENRGTSSFNASEEKFRKAWRQWEVDTERKIEAGKKQWDQKIQTFLVSKSNWQQEIKQAALEQSMEKMLAATGSSLNERLRSLADTTGIGVNAPQMNVTDMVAEAVQQFEREKPSGEKIFGEINKSISAFNVSLELTGATRFKGFENNKLEGNFTKEYAEFGKRMAILNNVKMYESFKKMIEEFKDALRKNDKEVFAGLYSAAMAEGYSLQGGSYTKETRGGWGEKVTADFMAYRYADIDGIMNRSMTEAGLDITTLSNADKIVELLEKKSDIDVKIFFEVQTMALEQAFKLAGGTKDKKGYYQQYSGERPYWKGYGGDLVSEGAAEQGGWENGAKNHKLAWRGLHEEETKLQNKRQTAQTIGQVTGGAMVSAVAIGVTIATAGAAAPAAAAMTAGYAGAQATIQAGSSFTGNDSERGWSQIGLGLTNVAVSAVGAFLGGLNYFGDAAKMMAGTAKTLTQFGNAAVGVTLQNAVGYAGSGVQLDSNGSLTYKGPSKGQLYSTLATTALSIGGAGINAGMGWKGATALGVSGTMNAISSGIGFNDDGGLQKEFSWKNFGTGMAVAAAQVGAGKLATSFTSNQALINETTRLAVTTTRAIATHDASVFMSTYSGQNALSALGNYLGDMAAKSANESMPGTPYRETMGGAAAMVALRPRREDSMEDTDTDPLGDAIDTGAAAIGRGVMSVWEGAKSFFSDLGIGISNTAQRIANFVTGNGFNTRAQIDAANMASASARLSSAQRLAIINSLEDTDLDAIGGELPAEVVEAYREKIKQRDALKSVAGGLKIKPVDWKGPLVKGTNLRNLVEALSLTNGASRDEVMDSLLKLNGVGSLDDLEGLVASGKKIQFGGNSTWADSTLSTYRNWDKLTQRAIATPVQGNQFLVTGERVLSQFPGHTIGESVIWRDEDGKETGRANDHTGPVSIYENEGKKDESFWTNKTTLASKHTRSVKQKNGTYKDVGQPWRGDVPGAGAWPGPNTPFKVLSVTVETGWGGTVLLQVGDNQLRYIHMDAISSDVYNARMNGGSGESLAGSTMVGYTREKRGITQGPHLHVESTNERHSLSDVLRILQGK